MSIQDYWDYVQKGLKAILSGDLSRIKRFFRNHSELDRRRKALHSHGNLALSAVSEAYHQAKIRPHLAFGTLLGFRRNNGLIAWDNDLDFGLVPENEASIQKFIDQMIQKGFTLKADFRLEGALQAIGNRSELNFIHGPSGLSIDIYFYHPWKDLYIYAADNRIAYYHESLLEGAGLSKNSVIGYALSFPKRYLDDLKSIDFMGSQVWVSTQAEACLEDLYGDWKTPTKKFQYRNVWAITRSSQDPGIELIRLPVSRAV